MAKKKATDLLDDPLISEEPAEVSDEPVTPFDRAYGVLTVTHGETLEMMTRTTHKLAEAINVGYTMRFNFRSRYLAGRINTLMRVHVSMDGKGRAEMVQALQAGSGVPGEFYKDDSGGMGTGFADVENDDDDGEE